MLAACDLVAGAIGSAWIVAGAGDDAAFAVALCLPLWIVGAKILGLYDAESRTLRHLTVDELPRMAVWAGTGCAAVSGFVSIVLSRPVGTDVTLVAALAAAVAGFVLRGGARVLWRLVTPPERTLVVGVGPAADAARRKLTLFPDMHLQAAGVTLGRGPELVSRDWLDNVDRAIFAGFELTDPRLVDALDSCRAAGVKGTIALPARGSLGAALEFDRVADVPLLHLGTGHTSRSTMLLKRTLDVVASTALLLVLPRSCSRSPLRSASTAKARFCSRRPAWAGAVDRSGCSSSERW